MQIRTESISVQTTSKALLPVTRTPARLLVVDDDPITAQLLRTVGGREGYQVVSASDGREAFRMLRSSADFTAAVFNMTVTQLNGVDILRYMKTEKRLIRIPVVIVAGNGGLKQITESFAAGAIAFLPKPLTTEKLSQAVRLAIGSEAVRKQSHDIGRTAA